MGRDAILRSKQVLDNSQFKKGLKESQSAASKLSSQIKQVGGAIAGAFTVSTIVNFAKEATAAYTEQIKSESKLVTALKGRRDIADMLIRQANELQGKSLFADEDIINGQALLATFTQNATQLKQLTPLVLDYAQAFGMDVASAAKQVGKALVSTNGAIGKSGIEAEGAAGSFERFDSVVQQLSDRFKDQAQNAIPEQMRKLRESQVSIDEFKESWGGMLIGMAQSLPLDKFKEGMDYVTWRLDKFKELGGGFGNWWKRFLHIGEFSEEVYKADQNLTGFEDAMASATEMSSGFVDNTIKSTQQLEAEATAAEDAAKAITEQAKAMRKLDEESMKRVTGGMKPITTEELMGSGALTGQQESILGALQQVSGSRITGMQLATEDVKELKMELKDLPESYAQTVDAMVESSQRLQSAFEAMGAAVGTALGEFIKGEAKFSDVASSLIQEIIKIVAGYLTESVAASFAGGASSGGPAAPFTGAAAAAAALSLFGSLVPALMASGGVVPGGYPGDTYPALLSSGEMVIPPHKLESVMGRGQQTVNVVGVIRGQDIHLINDKQTSKLSRYR